MPKAASTASARPAGYHHGDLRAGLIASTDRILAERGLEGFSLRAAARELGVTVAAPTHHFGSAAGLLSEVAALGFLELAKRLDVGTSRARPSKRLRLQGLGYVSFALDFPGRFHLMFRKDLLLPDHPGLAQAADAALARLEQTVRAMRGTPAEASLDAKGQAFLLATWSLVHGFAHLALDGKLRGTYGAPTHAELLKSVLPRVLLLQWPD